MSTEDTVPAAGTDVDSRKRALKIQLATAEATGDGPAARRLRGQLDALGREVAAKDREAAAQTEPETATSAPTGRTTGPAKSTTASK
ncbi:hypothetical protein O7626_00480 [Micromonospora sp. WMMD1102]|uniref:hypothetical protein n=1 Tax=Micromonospora sp. WMMD1102 TaxID=3016105 RepID=UPI002414DE0D|nr:hypothetical protein [Micromonospora sp. WMMD1102]MDG4784349.1 hypothetical protein [Micromonospora sp. WMMD1102]MDG4784422.1 hypothetical protein [Micromonospora sp. WMMD1102]